MSAYSIKDFGAHANGARVSTAQIQMAIDTCHRNGGGKVVIPEGGIYLCGTLNLKSGVELHLEKDTLLKASTQPGDYKDVTLAGEYGGNSGGFLIMAHEANNISITGEGAIDGQCEAFMDGWWTEDGKYIRKPKPFRTRIIGLIGCRKVAIKDITIRNSAQWTCHLTGCEDVDIDSVTILNGLDIPNCDGIDPDHCRNVRIRNCHIESGDDCIVIKTTKEFADYGPSENIQISGCTLISTSSAIKIGSETVSDIRNVTVEDCKIRRSNRGLAIQLRDSGNVENIIMKSCQVETRKFHPKYWGNGEAIYVTAVERHDHGKVGQVNHVTFHDIDFTGENGVYLYGTEERPLKNVRLENVRGTLRKTSRFPVNQHDLRPRHSKEHGGIENGILGGITATNVSGLEILDCHIVFDETDGHHWQQALLTNNVENLILQNLGENLER